MPASEAADCTQRLSLKYFTQGLHKIKPRPVELYPNLTPCCLKVLFGHGAAIDTTTAVGKLVFGIFAALAEFERELISERTVAGLASARARGRKVGRPLKMTAAKLRLAMAAMVQPGTKVGDPCQELGIARQTLHRHVLPRGELRSDDVKLLHHK
jgi:DNA invertase Pin-like site-specific DNA recombinase